MQTLQQRAERAFRLAMRRRTGTGWRSAKLSTTIIRNGFHGADTALVVCSDGTGGATHAAEYADYRSGLRRVRESLPPMPFLAARDACRALGFTLTRRPDGEFRLNRQGGSEATAYYTTDLEDAVGTARQEAARG